jgi:hypothetical protein
VSAPAAVKSIAAALALVLVSCASEHAALTLDTKAVPADRLVNLVNGRAMALRSMTGKGSLAFEGPDLAGSAYFSMALKKPDSLIVRLQGPFGIDVGFLFLSKGRFVVYNSMENRVVAGVPSVSAIRSVIPIDLTYDQIVNAFSGTILVRHVPSSMVRYGIDDGEFVLSYACGSDTCTYWVDPETEVVTRYKVQNGTGEPLLEATASYIEEQDGLASPRRIQVRFPDRQISIYYSSLVLNAPNPSFAYSVPENARATER